MPVRLANALYDSFGQRQVANIYEDLNQYTVVMETAPIYSRAPDSLSNVYVPANGSISAPTKASTRTAMSAAAVAAANAATAQTSSITPATQASGGAG